MAKTPTRSRLKPRDNGRKTKKKISPLASDKVPYIDYKEVDLLRRFMSDRAKIRSRRVSGNDSQQQRDIARAIKNAREMGLLAYTSRVTTQRRGGSGGGGGRGRDSDSRSGDTSGDAEADVVGLDDSDTETGGRGRGSAGRGARDEGAEV
jgi:small subunit ribosomal protein S18